MPMKLLKRFDPTYKELKFDVITAFHATYLSFDPTYKELKSTW